MHKAFALQVGQRRAELVGEEDEGGQVQAVLPHLQEGAQLRAARRRTGERREGRVYFPLFGEGQEVAEPRPLPSARTNLSQGAELHDDPHGVFGDHADQLDNVRVVELTHRHCGGTTRAVHAMCKKKKKLV